MSEIKPWREYIGKHEAYMIMCDVLNALCEKEAIKKTVYERLKQAPSEYQWVPCSERLPDEYDEYLCQYDDGDMIVGWLENEEWCKKNVTKEKIIAWMPLPEPYTEVAR